MFFRFFVILMVVFMSACEDVETSDVNDENISVVEAVYFERHCNPIEVYVSDTCRDIDVELINDAVFELNSVVSGEVIRVVGMQSEEGRLYDETGVFTNDSMIICRNNENYNISVGLGKWIGNDINLYTHNIQVSADFHGRSYEHEFVFVLEHELVHFIDGTNSTSEHSDNIKDIMYPDDKYAPEEYSDSDIELISSIVRRNGICI